jgi:hypothetical protein
MRQTSRGISLSWSQLNHQTDGRRIGTKQQSTGFEYVLIASFQRLCLSVCHTVPPFASAALRSCPSTSSFCHSSSSPPSSASMYLDRMSFHCRCSLLVDAIADNFSASFHTPLFILSHTLSITVLYDLVRYVRRCTLSPSPAGRRTSERQKPRQRLRRASNSSSGRTDCRLRVSWQRCAVGVPRTCL